VQLQPDAKWSDGTPVTLADIKTSLAIAYTQGTAGPAASSFEIAGVKDLGGGKIEVDQVPGVNNLLFAKSVLSQTMVADKVLRGPAPGRHLDDDRRGAGLGRHRREGRRRQARRPGKTIAAFAPAADVSAGPFVLTRVNPARRSWTATSTSTT